MFSVINDDTQRRALEKFYKNYKNCFFNIANVYLHNKYDAEDAVQEAFSAIAHKPDIFFGVSPTNRVGFMVAVIRNISSDMFNNKNKVTLEELDEEDSYDDNPFSFEDGIIGKVSRDKLKKFIESLPPLQRDVLTLRCLMGFSTAETAESLNISQSAVKKRLRLAKEAVREYVRKENEIYE